MGNEPVNNKTFGGVTFNWNEVRKSNVRTDENGQKIYFIEFKTGVTAEYPEQQAGEMSSRELTMWQSLDYDTETILNRIDGAKIKGSKKDDHIIAKETTNSEIDVSGDNNDDHVDVESKYTTFKHADGHTISDRKVSGDNEILLGEGDTATKTRRFITKTQKAKGGAYKTEEKTRTFDAKGPGTENRM